MSFGNFTACFAVILQQEGGYVNDPKDPGGPTNLGITIHTLSQWMGHPASVEDVKALTVQAVAPIYKRNYWDACACDQLPAGVDLMVFDMAVNAGIVPSARLLQEAVEAEPDGHIGPKTLNHVAEHDSPDLLIADLAAGRERYYRSLHNFPRYGATWLRRTKEVAHDAVGMTT